MVELAILKLAVVLARDPDATNLAWRTEATADHPVDRVLESGGVAHEQQQFVADVDDTPFARIQELIQHLAPVGRCLDPYRT